MMKRMLVSGAALLMGSVLVLTSRAQDEETVNMADMFQQVMGAMGQSAGGGNPSYEPVNFRELKAQLPEELLGMTRKSASGEKNSMFGMAASMAEARYEGADGEWVTLKISDIGGLGGFAAMAQYAWTMSEYDRESDTGFERTTTWKGHRAVEEHDTKSGRGKISLMLENKIVIDIEGDDVPFERLEEARDALDVDSMLGLRSAEAPTDEGEEPTDPTD